MVDKKEGVPDPEKPMQVRFTPEALKSLEEIAEKDPAMFEAIAGGIQNIADNPEIGQQLIEGEPPADYLAKVQQYIGKPVTNVRKWDMFDEEPLQEATVDFLWEDSKLHAYRSEVYRGSQRITGTDNIRALLSEMKRDEHSILSAVYDSESNKMAFTFNTETDPIVFKPQSWDLEE